MTAHHARSTPPTWLPAECLGVPFEDYREIEAINWSKLKKRDPDQDGGSPLAYRHAWTAPDADTTGRKRGRLLHTLVLESERFTEDYAVWCLDDGSRATKKYKAWAAEQEEAGRACMLDTEVAEARAQADNIRAHPLIGPMLERCVTEVTIVWEDPITGLRCKGRVDALYEVEPGWVRSIDLKGTSTLCARTFGRLGTKAGYHGQQGHYSNGLQALPPVERVDAVIVAHRIKRPLDCRAFHLDEDAMWAGEQYARRLLDMVHADTKSDAWPGASATLDPFALPAWAYPNHED